MNSASIPSHKTASANIRLDGFICLFLVLAIFMVFWQVRDHAFINLDDDLYVTENHYVKSGLNLESVMWSLTSLHSSNWHPLTWLSHMLDVHLFGLKPGRHHMTSVFFHVVNSLLLFFVLKRMSTDRWQSAFLAALFALHPLHVESVAWVSERKDVLSTFFGLMAIWSYARYAQGAERNWYLAALLFFILGLMSKPMLVTLPFVLLLLDIWPLGRLQIDKTAGRVGLQSWPTIRPLVAEKIPFFALTAAAIGVAYLAQKTGGSIAALEMYPLSLRFANAVVAYGNYIIKMMWPFNLTVFYPYLWKLPLWQVFTTGLALMAITVLVIKTLPTRPFMFVRPGPDRCAGHGGSLYLCAADRFVSDGGMGYSPARKKMAWENEITDDYVGCCPCGADDGIMVSGALLEGQQYALSTRA
jgi:hypothetical protein